MSYQPTYESLALDWQPSSRLSRQFYWILAFGLVLALLATFTVSFIKVPEQQREQTIRVPERIAQFIEAKPKPKPKPKPLPKPKPKPKPEPIPEKSPKIVKQRVEVKKPVTQQQQKARDKAQQSGLLALGNELADLIDTSAEVSGLIGGKVTSQTGNAVVEGGSGFKRDAITGGANQGSGGVQSEQYQQALASTNSKLSARELTQVRQSLVSKTTATSKPSSSSQSRSASSGKRSGGIRAEEEITIVFDRNKSKLYSLYNRARRKNPSLKGKIVMEITIGASGKVSSVRLLSSELNDPKLEKSLIARIKQFNFGAQNVETIKVTYPIEFLPS